MLADSLTRSPASGSLAPGVHRPGTFVRGVIEFVAHHLPRWRDDPDRPHVHSERELTAQLAAYLNTEARRNLDAVQFLTEVPDEVAHNRSLDLVVQPSGASLVLAGRRYTRYQVLLPIECKRLPVPPDPRRDPREYVHTSDHSLGGIQRFKHGHHGAAHPLALIIAFIQADLPNAWLTRINHWIDELAQTEPTWSDEHLAATSAADTLLRATSTHRRDPPATAIELEHLWIALE